MSVSPSASHPVLEWSIVDERPLHEQNCPAALAEVTRDLAEHANGKFVTSRAAVEKRRGRNSWRSGDERRLRGDQVERLAVYGFKEVALSELDVLDAVQGSIQARQQDRPRVDIDAHAHGRMPGEEERGRPGAAAEIEKPVDRTAWIGRLAKIRGRGSRAHHRLTAKREVVADEVEVVHDIQ